MPRFVVETTRTEYIAYEVEAESAEEAEATYLAAGDEVASDTLSESVDKVSAGTAQEVWARERTTQI